MAVFAPIPRARVRIAISVKPGFLPNWRAPKRTSRKKFCITKSKIASLREAGSRLIVEESRGPGYHADPIRADDLVPIGLQIGTWHDRVSHVPPPLPCDAPIELIVGEQRMRQSHFRRDTVSGTPTGPKR